MRIIIKDFKSLIKAVQNRAHLFPVKVLINGKNKTFYGMRYKSGNKAMEIAKKQMKLPENIEVSFDSKDGKAKGLSEKEVLDLYTKAGKHGSLQDFIASNFKRPKVKSDQLSINDMQKPEKETSPAKNNENSKANTYGNLSKYQFRRLQQKGASLWDKNGEKRLYFNDLGIDLAEKVSNNPGFKGKIGGNAINEQGGKMYYDMDSGKFYTKVNGGDSGKFAGAIFNEAKSLLENLKKEEESNPKDINRLTDNPNLTARQEKALLERLGADADIDNTHSHTWIKPDVKVMQELIGKIGGGHQSKAASRRANETLFNLKYDVNRNKVFGDTKDREGVRDMAQTAINNLIEEVKSNELVNKLAAEDKVLKEKRSSQIVKEKIKAREKTLTGEQAGKFRYRLGTKKIDSKHEYQEVKTTNELVEKIKPIKDMHTDIKGRAIMDMLGINVPLYSKRNGNAFNVLISGVGTCAAGLCRFLAEKDGSRINKEICLVAETGDPVHETKTAIHECMHAKVSEIVTANLDKLGKGERRIALKSLEETLVETAGQAISNLVHGKDTDRQIHSYADQMANCLPCIWDLDEFKNVRKEGTHGIGREIYNQLTAKNGDFLANVLDKYQDSKKDPAMSNKYKAIESKMLERTDKVEKIQQDTGKSDIANLVEELKRGTISLEGALNSSNYRELAAILITKFLEDEDLDEIDALALSF